MKVQDRIDKSTPRPRRRRQDPNRDTPSTRQSAQSTLNIDLREDYSPRALGILQAAQRVVVRDGAEKLSLRAIAREAGESTSLVLYHFSSMEKLEALLLDSLWRDIVVEFVARLNAMPTGQGARIDALVEFHAKIARKPGLYRTYVDLVAHVVPNPGIRENVALIYETYRLEINRPFFAAPGLADADVAGRAALALAAGEGIPIDALVSAREHSQDVVFELLSHILKVAAGVRSAPPRDAVDRRDDSKPVRPLFDELPSAGTARRLIEAGQNLIRTGGVRSVSLEACAKESGESRPSVGYHFGNKKKFLDAVAAAALRDLIISIEQHLNKRGGFTAHDLATRYFRPKSPFALVILMLPLILQTPSLAALARDANDYIHLTIASFLKAAAPGGSHTNYVGLARLYTSSLIGLSLQHLYDPRNFDPKPALECLCKAVLRPDTASAPGR
ncbi:MAG: TetR/AcrR family transcriptional regulator [Hyphomicrobiales bacterium]|nr:MAG: TetR/AcrR family transcriptional regulator [Hyphomicrobiales bacterium]